MKARLILVHGIGPIRDVPAELDAWTGALAAGARRAGHSAVADWLTSLPDDAVGFAHYADLFFPAGAQGVGVGVENLSDDEVGLLAAILAESIEEQQSHDRSVEERRALRRAQARLQPAGQAQGAGQLLRQAINAATTLLDLPYLRVAGRRLTGVQFLGQLGQVSRYLARPAVPAGRTLDGLIRDRLHHALLGGPTVLVAHSLGTVVAFEALHERAYQVPILVTLGSPLAMRSVVRPRPGPPATTPGAGGGEPVGQRLGPRRRGGGSPTARAGRRAQRRWRCPGQRAG